MSSYIYWIWIYAFTHHAFHNRYLLYQLYVKWESNGTPMALAWVRLVKPSNFRLIAYSIVVGMPKLILFRASIFTLLVSLTSTF